VKSSAVLPVLEPFSDGSYRSELVIKDEKGPKQQVLSVRVIAYEICDPGRPQAGETTYRLITTILDPKRAPAPELAALYPERWEFETLLDELKTHERGPKVVLRSKSPDGVHQEIYGYLCTHYAIRALMNEVAGQGGLDPDRVSFTRSVREHGEVFVLGSARPRTRSATHCKQRSPRSLASCSLSARFVLGHVW